MRLSAIYYTEKDTSIKEGSELFEMEKFICPISN